MNRKLPFVIIFLLVIFLLVFSGCITPTQTPEQVAKANETVKNFLDEHPDSEVIVTHFDENSFEHIADEIKSDCNNQYVGQTEFYRIKISDAESGLHIIVWVDWKTQKVECIFKKGVEAPEERCTPGWACRDENYSAYQNEDCSWGSKTFCEFGCSGGECQEQSEEDLCEGIECGDYCSGSTRFYNGRCVGGQCTYSSVQCEHGCENGMCAGDPCAGVSCTDYCVGRIRYHSGSCSGGQCNYSSTVCEYGCENGLCKVNPCTGITCPNTCDGSTRKYNGQCVGGVCQYSSEACQYGCENGACKANLCAGVTCPNTCDGSTRKYNGQCVNGVCQYSSEVCQQGCENGACKADPCAGVQCPDSCEGAVRKWNGQCVGGACQYESSECGAGCANGACNPSQYYCEWSWPQKIIYNDSGMAKWICTYERPYCQLTTTKCCKYAEGTGHYDCMDCEAGGCTAAPLPNGTIFVTSITWQGNLGGVSGADAKCQSTATNAERAGTWKALISDSTTNAKDRVPDTVYRKIDGTVIANSKSDLFDGSIQTPINLTETGVIPTTTLTWTGTTDSGVYSGLACSNWTTSTWDFSYSGTTGSANNTDLKWLQHSNNSLCGNSAKLFCIKIA